MLTILLGYICIAISRSWASWIRNCFIYLFTYHCLLHWIYHTCISLYISGIVLYVDGKDLTSDYSENINLTYASSSIVLTRNKNSSLTATFTNSS